jgi:hypothetical protein
MHRLPGKQKIIEWMSGWVISKKVKKQKLTNKQKKVKPSGLKISKENWLKLRKNIIRKQVIKKKYLLNSGVLGCIFTIHGDVKGKEYLGWLNKQHRGELKMYTNKVKKVVSHKTPPRIFRPVTIVRYKNVGAVRIDHNPAIF